MSPGATAFTVMFREATSSATAFVKPMSPAFDAELLDDDLLHLLLD